MTNPRAIIAQVARHQGREVYAFTRPGNEQQLIFARSMGVDWAGPSDAPPPVTLDAALIFAPNGALVPRALAAVGPGGSVICAGIHMSEIPAFPYELLWGERSLRSVANLTRRDGVEFDRSSLAVNRFWPGLVAGEWHNNHHLFPTSVRAGFLPWQPDFSFAFIWFYRLIGGVSSWRNAHDRFYERHYTPYLARENAARKAPW